MFIAKDDSKSWIFVGFRAKSEDFKPSLLDSFVMKLSIDGLMVYLSLEKLEKQELQFIDQDDNTKT